MAFDLMDIDGDVIALFVGASLVLAAIGIDRTRHRVITPAWYLVGAIAALAGLFELVERTPCELTFLLAAAGIVYLSVAVQSRTLLFVATLAILAYTGVVHQRTLRRLGGLADRARAVRTAADRSERARLSHRSHLPAPSIRATPLTTWHRRFPRYPRGARSTPPWSNWDLSMPKSSLSARQTYLKSARQLMLGTDARPVLRDAAARRRRMEEPDPCIRRADESGRRPALPHRIRLLPVRQGRRHLRLSDDVGDPAVSGIPADPRRARLHPGRQVGTEERRAGARLADGRDESRLVAVVVGPSEPSVRGVAPRPRTDPGRVRREPDGDGDNGERASRPPATPSSRPTGTSTRRRFISSASAGTRASPNPRRSWTTCSCC